jgi:hypothetical protein
VRFIIWIPLHIFSVIYVLCNFVVHQYSQLFKLLYIKITQISNMYRRTAQAPTTMWNPRLWFVWRNLSNPPPSVLSCPFTFMWHPQSQRFRLFYPLQSLVKMDFFMTGVQWLKGYTCHDFCNLIIRCPQKLPWPVPLL